MLIAMLHLFVVLGMLLLKLLLKLRLGIPVLYIFLANTVWARWANYNDILSAAILFMLVSGGVAISWIHTVIKHIRGQFA